jgi:hypothetical protein
MKPFPHWRIAAGVVAIAVLAVCGWCIRRDGIAVGALDQKISAAADKSKILERVIHQVDDSAKIEAQKSVAKKAEYHAARAKVRLEGDTVIADGQHAVMPSVTQLIKAADARGEQDSTTIVKEVDKSAARDSLIAAQGVHIDLLQEAKRPRFGTKTGFVVGAAATVGVIWVAVKIIKVVAKR